MGFLSSIDLAVEEDKCKPLIEISSSGGLSGTLAAAAEGGLCGRLTAAAEGPTALGHFSPDKESWAVPRVIVLYQTFPLSCGMNLSQKKKKVKKIIFMVIEGVWPP